MGNPKFDQYECSRIKMFGTNVLNQKSLAKMGKAEFKFSKTLIDS